MPASSSSSIDSALDHLVAFTDTLGDVAAGVGRAGLLAVLSRIADPRKPRGVRHRLPVLLGLAVCAVLAGARSYVAIAGWAADADRQTRDDLGVGPVVATVRERPRSSTGSAVSLAVWNPLRSGHGRAGRRLSGDRRRRGRDRDRARR